HAALAQQLAQLVAPEPGRQFRGGPVAAPGGGQAGRRPPLGRRRRQGGRLGWRRLVRVHRVGPRGGESGPILPPPASGGATPERDRLQRVRTRIPWLAQRIATPAGARPFAACAREVGADTTPPVAKRAPGLCPACFATGGVVS